MKEKQKVKSLRDSTTKLLIAILGVGFFAFSPLLTQADATCGQGNNGQNVQTCEMSQITLQTDISVNGQVGNFIKASQTGNFTFTVTVTLKYPASLTFNKDLISAPAGNGFFSKTDSPGGTVNLNGTFMTVTPFNTSKLCGSPATGIANTGFTYAQCSNPPFDQGQNLSGQTITAGSILFKQDYTVDKTQYASLGITTPNNGTDPNSGINQFLAFPGLLLTSGANFYKVTFTSAGKSVYVQLYKDDTALQAAQNQQPAVCASGQNSEASTTVSCVPSYAGNAGTGTNLGVASPLDAVGKLIANVISALIAFLQNLIYWIFGFLIAPLLESVLRIRTYTDTFAGIIYPGWEIIRNLCDIFFILAIIAIGMATLFRIESYKYKDLLVQLMIAALMVNFSLVISQAVLGLADTAQNQFLPANAQVIKNLAGPLMVQSRDLTKNLISISSGGGVTIQIIQPFINLSMALGTFIVFTAIAAFLLVRIVVLWVLLMVSPVAYVAGVLPATAGLRSQWWGLFLKYAFFTPIMAFFLNMAAIIATKYFTNPVLQTVLSGQNVDLGPGNVTNFVFLLGSQALLLVFLLAGLKVAETWSIAGASIATKYAKGAMALPFVTVGKPAKFLSEAGFRKLKTKYDEKSLGLAGSKSAWGKAAYGVLHFPSYFKAIGTDAEKEREKMKHLTEAGALKVKRLTPMFRREGRDPLYHAMLEQGEERLNEVYGHYTGNETEEVRRLRELEAKALGGDKKASMMLLAQMLRAAPNKHVNQFMDDKGLDYTQPNLIGLLDHWEHEGVMSHTINEEFQTALSEQGYKIADFTLTELSDGKHAIHVNENTTTGQYQVPGLQEWKQYREWVRNNATSAQQYRDLQGGIDSNGKLTGMMTDPRFAAQKAAFIASVGGSFDEHNFENMIRRENQILKRDVNASKLERKSATFHNALATTDASLPLNADGSRRQVLGESGNYTLTHLNNTDIWGAGRAQWTDKQKKRMVALVTDHGVDSASRLNAITNMFTEEYKDELAREGVFKTNAEVQDAVKRKVRNFVSVVYASKAAAGPDKIAQIYGIAPTHVDELDELLTDNNVQDMIDKISK